MAGAVSIRGMARVQGNLNRALKTTLYRTEMGMIKGGLLIQREGQHNVPVDIGNLKASARTTWQRNIAGMRVVVSFSTEYAIYVHEIPATHTVGDWKYLERAVTENHFRILETIRAEARQ